MIKINNKRDYLRFYWLFLLGMVLFATTLMLSILRMSWVALLLYLILHYFYQKAFQLEVDIRRGYFHLRKTFLGISYWHKKLQLEQAIWESLSSRWILHGKDGKRLELMEDALTKLGGLRIFDGQKVEIIADASAARQLLSSLEAELALSEVKIYHFA